MAIRQIVSRSIKDGTIVDADANSSFSTGAGFFQGENGSTVCNIKEG